MPAAIVACCDCGHRATTDQFVIDDDDRVCRDPHACQARSIDQENAR